MTLIVIASEMQVKVIEKVMRKKKEIEVSRDNGMFHV